MSGRRTVAVVTGTRAEFGLLRSVMTAIRDHPDLDLRVAVTGTHLLAPEHTADEVAGEFEIAATIPMQRQGGTGRWEDAAALGRGVTGMSQWLARETPAVVLVLGDRIEAFAAASAASVGGIRVAHMHGGDRAAGIADEAIRHAVTKLAHVHLPATEESARRIAAMGEDPGRIHVVGSPAIDDLDDCPPLPEATFENLGRPEVVFLLHPTGGPAQREQARAARVLESCRTAGRVLALHPNHDPGREGIVTAITDAGGPNRAHLPRREFIGLLRRVRVLVGNSSAGLIEAAALGVTCINVGDRQAGRERPENVIDVADPAAGDGGQLEAAIAGALAPSARSVEHPYGRGAGPRTAEVLAAFDPDRHPLNKMNVY